MQISLISDSRKKLLIHLLEDPSYNKDILMDGDLPKTIVVQDDGSVLIGRTPKNWWNSLFPEDKRVIEFAMVAFRIAANLNKIANIFMRLNILTNGFKLFLKKNLDFISKNLIRTKK